MSKLIALCDGHGKVIRTCLNCGRKFEVYRCYLKRGGGKYCSGSCKRSYLNKTNNPAWREDVKEKISLHHADVSGSNNPMYGIKGKDAPNFIDGRSFYNGRISRKIGLANGIKRVCIICGEDDINKLHLHHIDGNHYNNELSNMIFLCYHCHLTIAHHYLQDELGRFTGSELNYISERM